MSYTDGYAVTVALNFPVNDVAMNEHVGFCLTSQIAGQSCFSLSPTSGTNGNDAQIFVSSVKSYWNTSDKIKAPSATNNLMSAMTYTGAPSGGTDCFLSGFNKSWRCTKAIFTKDDESSLKITNGFYHVECSRFLPIEGLGKADGSGKRSDYRFAPYSIMNKDYTPMSLWYYKTTTPSGTQLSNWNELPLSNFSGAASLISSAAALLAVYALF
jgi:hypothetical protein